MKKIIPTEYEECVVFSQWLTLKGIKHSHIPNETFTKSWRAKMKNKMMGVSSGVPDYIVCAPKALLFIEMKRTKGGILSKEQTEWLEALYKYMSVLACTCKGAEEAIKKVERFL